MKKKKDCGCKEASKLRKKMLNTKECFEVDFDASDIIGQYNFQKNKPFKVLFKEQLDVVWNKQPIEEKTEPKKLTKKDKKQKEAAVMSMKKKGVFKELKNKYGEGRAKKIMYGKATNHAKKTP